MDRYRCSGCGLIFDKDLDYYCDLCGMCEDCCDCEDVEEWYEEDDDGIDI